LILTRIIPFYLIPIKSNKCFYPWQTVFKGNMLSISHALNSEKNER